MESLAQQPLSFKCGCGKCFLSPPEFKQHSVVQHKGEYVLGGSHYICRFSDVVMPAVKRAKGSKKTEKGKVKEKEKEKEKQKVAKEEKKVSGKGKDKEEHEVRGKSQPPPTRSNSQNPTPSEESVFQLIPNPKCKTKPYFCGPCNLIFTQPTTFIAHCIEVCQCLESSSSSHFVSSVFDSQLPLPEASQLSPQTRLASRRQRLAAVQRSDDIMPMMFKWLFDHREKPFKCGKCSIPISKYSYKRHMDGAHQQMIPNGSSHIVLRMSGCIERHLYISPFVEWESSEAAYYCPCKPEVKMSMKALVKHMSEVHMGISPFYYP